MATIQAKNSRGHKYWYIVESRRVNGKPRPVVLAYLGKPEDILEKMQNNGQILKVKSHSYGAVATLLQAASSLNIPEIINEHVHSQRPYWPNKFLRNNLTAGMTLLLGAIGRICTPTSKQRWWEDWAKNTCLDYLLRVNLSGIDSQHFWDLMDCIPVKSIEDIESKILKNVKSHYQLDTDTLFYDTTNFYTFIDTTNERCDIARRGRNKQKRHDLRQVGLALVVTRNDYIPIFHHAYQGNIADCVVFEKVIRKIKKRMRELKLDITKHTLVFDRGCNSKTNLELVNKLKFHYVGALSPSHHKDLVEEADGNFVTLSMGEDNKISTWKQKRIIWNQERTVVVLISEKLKQGQLRGVYNGVEKRKKQLRDIQIKLRNPRSQFHKDRTKLSCKIDKLIRGQFISGVIAYKITETKDGLLSLKYKIDKKKIEQLEDKLGFRILMTNRHDWTTKEIISAYHGQAIVEQGFKHMKNHFHCALTPGFHWTDQKIIVHYFMCVTGYLLATLVWKSIREKTQFNGSLDNMLDYLNNIRLSTMLQKTGKKIKTVRKIEEMSPVEDSFVEALGIREAFLKPMKIKGVGVYN